RSKEGTKNRDRLSPPLSFFEEARSSPSTDDKPSNDKANEERDNSSSISENGVDNSASSGAPHVVGTLPPEHMAPKRAKWTSPPPPNADVSDVRSFENRFEQGLEIAAQSSLAREARYNIPSSSRYAASEISEEHSDIETNP